MNFTSFSAFIHMGGYAGYVWPAFAIAILLLLVNSMVARKRLRKLIKTLRSRYAHSS